MSKLKWVLGFVLLAGSVVTAVVLTRPKGDILIGAVLPVTGEYGAFGASVARGIGLAIEELNAAGGVEGRKIVVDVEDSAGVPGQGRAAAEELIFEKGVAAIIGAMSSDVTLAIAPVAEESRTVLLSPASSSPEVTNAGDFVFRNYPSETLQSELIVGYAFRHSCRRAAILTIDDDDDNSADSAEHHHHQDPPPPPLSFRLVNADKLSALIPNKQVSACCLLLLFLFCV